MDGCAARPGVRVRAACGGSVAKQRVWPFGRLYSERAALLRRVWALSASTVCAARDLIEWRNNVDVWAGLRRGTDVP